MALKAHLESLNRQHEELEYAIAMEVKHPSSDDLRINELKRKKLRIKDQLAELNAQLKPN